MVYNIIINTGVVTEGYMGFITYRKINSIERFRKYVNRRHPNWRFATLYDKVTRDKIKVIKP